MAEVWPQPNEVKHGVIYGPNGNDYTGTLGYAPPASGDPDNHFFALLERIIADIGDLKNSSGDDVFASVGTFWKYPAAGECPACNVFPLNDPSQQEGITPIGVKTAYRFAIGLALKGRYDQEMTRRVLEIRSRLRNWFEVSPNYTAYVPGYQGMTVENGELASMDDDKIPQGVAIFGTGLTLICNVQRLKGH